MTNTRTHTVATPWGPSITLNIRTEKDGDLNVIGEVLQGDTYRIATMERAPTLVFDIGAHIGTFTNGIKSRFPDARVVAIEPNARSFELLKANTERFGESVICVHGAVSYARGTVLTDGIGATGGGFMTTREAFEAQAAGKTAADGFIYSIVDDDVSTYTLGDLLEIAEEAWGVMRVADLVKLDCEGGEVDLLQHASPDELDIIGDIVGEYHIEGGYRAFEEIAKAALPAHRFEGRPNEIADGRMIGWFRAFKGE